ncbi:phosphatase PAP2 family protein [Maribacter hydrothermalis]|uniref:Phosphoesterase n=1 Tax=Maribacter hydrothermalis TaxID=1836467 RepID=A0A1B7Z1S0_9FLAO|nr:phosphatase PAP2 family protein [Maribacter hydrothermalis]APQ18288.1 phosphatase PAP2 family protein [Maribacter hydrothermalis]OBR36634.1 phosphoesterase [Maribacter hydrothermalis]
MLQELLQLDKDFFLFLNGLGTPQWDNFFQFLSHKLSAIPLYIFLLILTYQKFGGKRTLVLLVTVALLITVTDQLSNFFKYGIQRLRPCHNPEITPYMRLVKSYCGGQFGYFSAHAANAFAVAVFFGSILKSVINYIGIFLVLWAALVAYSRIYLGVHFPLDIVTGALIGSLFGWLFVKLFLFSLRKFSL